MSQNAFHNEQGHELGFINSTTISVSSFTPIVPLSSRRPAQIKVKSQSKVVMSRCPVVILPGLGNAGSDYKQLEISLKNRGHSIVRTVPIARWQWLLNALGFFTVDYWTSNLKPSPILDWYFSQVNSTIEDIAISTPTDQPINLLGHSAGGWLARVYLSHYSQSCAVRVKSLVTLGTPHMAPPDGVIDQTRGLLRYVATHCDISGCVDNFVCVTGNTIKGTPFGKGTLGQYIAYLSYAAVCGDGNVDGDGVTPTRAASVPNSEVISCDCGHSMLTTPSSWYGADHIFPQWADRLL